MKKCVEFTALNLGAMCSGLHSLALEAWARGDMSGVLGRMSSDRYWDFMADNLAQLTARGFLEQAFIHAFSGVRENLGQAYSVVEAVVSLVDREKLRALGDPLPADPPWTVYRGVAGKGKARRVRGWSWTSDLEQARWFANRFPELSDPAVFSASVGREQVLFYTNDRDEKEFALSLPAKHRVKRVQP